MDIGALLLLFALLLLIALFVSWPFLEHTTVDAFGEEQTTSVLLTEKDRIMSALQELDFDHTLGKIPAEEYPIQRSNLLQRGADILRQLDDFTPTPSPRGRWDSAETRVETAVTAHRADEAVAHESPTDEDIEALIARKRGSLKDKVTGFCPQCGRPLLRSDSFCPQCGYALK